LLMISVRIDDSEFQNWLAFLEKQPPLDPEFPQHRFFDNARWWQLFHNFASEPSRNPLQVPAYLAEFFLVPPRGATALGRSAWVRVS
jgi:hypothetical protein